MTEIEVREDRPLALHPLVYLVEGDEVTIGRADIDSYAIFPADGAALVRRLADGASPDEAAHWYEEHYGERADVDHVVAALHELGFLRADADKAPDEAPVRWRRLGTAVFAPPSMVAFAVLLGWALVTMLRRPDLVPTYHSLFFTQYYTVIELVLLAAAFPLILLHESFHALAGRRLGLRSRLRIGRRLYFLVAETALDGLVAVPRRKRYLPILAGMLADLLAVAALVLAADLTRLPGGALSLTGRVCLAIAFATVVRIAWQFFFYLRTDLYALITTVLGCVDLHTTSRRLLANRVNRLLGRRHRLVDESVWHPVDRRVARWYAWLIVVGYSVNLTTFVLALAPATWRMFAGAFARFGGNAGAGQLADTAVFLAFNLGQVLVVVVIAVRERRERSTYQHVIA